MSDDRTRTASRSRSGTSGQSAGSTLEFDAGEASTEPPGSTSESGDDTLRSRASGRARALFSPRAFLASLVVTAAGLLAAGALVPLPLSGLVGVFLATFAVGLVAERRRYAETAAAGGTVVAGSVLADFLVVSVLGGFGLPLAVIGAAVGAAVGAAGAYFGRDLRAGLTRDVDGGG